MTAESLNSATPNNEIGLYFSRSRRVTLDVNFGEMATWIKAGTAGDIVWYNSKTKEYGIWNLEAGETAPIACDMIVTSAIIDGISESTTATNILWASSASNIGEKF